MRVEKPIHLYWVTVPEDPSEDWFVFATQAHLDRTPFEDYEGFESREAEVRLVERDVTIAPATHRCDPIPGGIESARINRLCRPEAQRNGKMAKYMPIVAVSAR